MSTRLGQKLTGKLVPSAGATSEPTALGRRLSTAGRRGEEVTLPDPLGRVFIEMIGDRAWLELEVAVDAEMARLGVGPLSVVNAPKWESERARRALSMSCRDPDDHSKPFGTLEEWGVLDSTILNLAWTAWSDVRERLDPMAVPLTEDVALAVQAAVKKKDVPLLRTFGVATLSLWLASMADQLSTSPSPSSPSTPSDSTE